MVEGPMLLVIFVVALTVLLVSIVKFKANPFLALLGTAIFTGFLVGFPAGEIGDLVATGFGNVMRGIGIVVGLGIILGRLLAQAHATDRIAMSTLNAVGEKRSPLAIALSGYAVSIPVFQDAAFVILMPLARKLSRITKYSFLTFVTALGVSTVTTHSMVIPTPGPVAVAGNMEVDFGVFLGYGLLVSLPAVLLGAVAYAMTMKDVEPTLTVEAEMEMQEEAELERQEAAELERGRSGATATTTTGDSPSTGPTAMRSFGVLVLPIALILTGSVMAFLLEEGTGLYQAFAFIGDKNMALFIGVLVGFWALREFVKGGLTDVIVHSAAAAGMIFLITGAGGALGLVITESGIGSYLVDTMTGLAITPVVLAFMLSQMLRVGQGSTTVALITTSAILGPVAAEMGSSPVLVGLAACAGGIGLSMPNDSGFWVVSRFSGISVQNTFRTWTAGGTIAGFTALAMVLLLSLFADVLPGL